VSEYFTPGSPILSITVCLILSWEKSIIRLKKERIIAVRRNVIIGFLIFCMICLFSISLSNNVIANEQASKDEVDELYRLFDVGNVSTHYVVAIDTSLSMKDSFSSVRDGLSALTDSFKKGDKISIITFDKDPKVIYQGAIEGSKNDFIKELPKSPNKEGRSTDIGKALESVTRQIEKSDEELQLVFFLTDGLDEPPDSSPFKKNSDSSWEGLRNKAKEIEGNDIKVHGIGLNSNTDIDLIKKIFPGTTQITLSPNELKNYFSSLKGEIREAKLMSELDKELRGGKIKITPEKDGGWGEIESEGRLEREYKIKSDYEHLSSLINLKAPRLMSLSSNRKKDVEDFRVRLVDDNEVILSPGESKIVTISVTAPEFTKSRKVGSVKETFDGELVLDIEATLLPESGLKSLETDPKVGVTGRRREISFYRMDGFPFTMAAIYVLAAVIFSGVIVRTVIYPVGKRIKKSVTLPPLTGRLAFSNAPENKNLPGPISLSSFGKSAVIGKTGDINIKGEGIENRHAEFFSKWVDGKPVVAIRRIDGSVRVSKNTIDVGKAVIDEIELQQGDIVDIAGYKIQWL